MLADDKPDRKKLKTEGEYFEVPEAKEDIKLDLELQNYFKTDFEDDLIPKEEVTESKFKCDLNNFVENSSVKKEVEDVDSNEAKYEPDWKELKTEEGEYFEAKDEFKLDLESQIYFKSIDFYDSLNPKDNETDSKPKCDGNHFVENSSDKEEEQIK